MADILLVQIYSHLCTNYRPFVEYDLEDNKTRLIVQFCNLQEILTLVDSGGATIKDKDVVCIALCNINHSGIYPLDVHELRICPVIEHTYANVKILSQWPRFIHGVTGQASPILWQTFSSRLQQVEDALVNREVTCSYQ